MITLLQTFWLFKHIGLATDDVTLPLHRLRVEDALQKTYLKANPDSLVNLLVFDLDRDDAEQHILSLVWDDGVLPEPTWITVNPATGHAHVAYVLADPVSTSAKSSQRPVRYLEAIYRAMLSVMGADAGYTRRIMRNPMTHATRWLNESRYSLAELASFLDLKTVRSGKKGSAVLSGRNNTLFSQVKAYGYTQVRKSGFKDIADELLVFAQSLNNALADPLPLQEINSIVSSVSRYIHAHFNSRAFSIRQRVVSRMRKTSSLIVLPEQRIHNEYERQRHELRKYAADLYNSGKSYKDIAAELKLRVTQVRGILQYARALMKSFAQQALASSVLQASVRALVYPNDLGDFFSTATNTRALTSVVTDITEKSKIPIT